MSHGTAMGARAGATTLAAAAVTVALLQVLQQTVGAFDPRPVVTALIAVAAGFATLAVERLRARTRARHGDEERIARLKAALRCWPLPLLRDVDPDRLGVFPARRGDARGGAYVRRAADERIEAALAASPFVLVFGPARAGKSRTALEAARRALPDAQVIVPRDADGLADLTALDPPLEPSAPRAVLWLDGLERFAEVLDPDAFGSMTIVATIRTRDYDELLMASGDKGEAAKAVAARARAFELGAELDPGERAEAERLYAGEAFGAGLGAGLSSTGKEEDEPAAPPLRASIAPVADGPMAQPAWRDRLFAIPSACCAAALLAIAIVALSSGFSTPEPPTIGEQVDAIKRTAAAGARRLAISQPVDFHGSGDPSYLFVFQVKDFYKRYFGREKGEDLPPSDEIRIYDRRGDRLVERFRFQPTNETAVFQRRYLGDLDGNGEAELVGGFGLPGQATEALLPLVLSFDGSSGEYRIDAVQTTPPELGDGVRPRPQARPFLDAYRKPLTLRDARHTIRGHRVQDFAVTDDPDRLVSALVTDPRTVSLVGRVELRGNILMLSGDRPRLIPCLFASGARLTAPWSSARVLSNVVLERWLPFISRHECAPSF